MTSNKSLYTPQHATPSPHFWKKWSGAYAIPSTCTDYDDWQCILSTLTTELVRGFRSKNQAKVLDVGAGLATNSFSICNQIYTRYGKTSQWFLLEPDRSIHNVARTVFPNVGASIGCIGLGDALPEQTFDAVLLLHSSYYIPNFDAYLRILRENYLEAGGVVVVCAVPSSSLFFLGLDELRLPNTADTIVAACEKSSVPVSALQMHSRVRFPNDVLEDENTLMLLWEFFTDRRVDRSTFIKRFRAVFSNEVDCNDWIVTIGQVA